MSKINNADMPANPISSQGFPSKYSTVVDQEGLCTGLTKREQMAMTALQGILSRADYVGVSCAAALAVTYADALLEELGKSDT